MDNNVEQSHWIFRFLNGFCINLGAFFSQTMLLAFLISEKESCLKFGLKSAGLSEAAYFGSIAIHQLTPVCVCTSILIPVALFLDKVARFSSILVLWAFFFLYLVAGTSFTCFLSALVPSSKAAQNINSLLVFIVAVVYVVILSLGIGDALKVPLCVIPSFAMHFIGDRMVVLEGANRGLTPATVWESFPLTPTISCNLLCVALIMALSAVFWLWAAWYLSQVLPDHLGNRRPLCFLCTSRRTNRVTQSPRRSMLEDDDACVDDKGTDYVVRTHANTTADAADAEAGCKGISKRFKRSTGALCRQETILAVKDLRLQVRQGEVFCLLGQNGAGKTTSVAMMTGQLPLSGGTIRYCLGVGSDMNGGVDAASEDKKWERIQVGAQGGSNAAVQRLRKHLGVCNQYDVLFSNLNALEHAFLFAALRRSNNSTFGAEEHEPRISTHHQVKALLKQAGLPPGDELKQVGTLSGGNRRKVSLAMALMGCPGLIFLDEPTAGMDPCSRRCVWEVVRDARDKGSAVVLTTHFLDEAECLGETVGIMKAGEMACCGSSLQLKRMYGDGLTITLTHTDPSPKNMEASVAALDNILMDKATENINDYESVQPDAIRSMYPLAVSAGEINVGVPYTCPPDKLERLLARLEDNLEQLQCSDLVLSTTTLERVFLNVAAAHAGGSSSTNTDAADMDEVAVNLSTTAASPRWKKKSHAQSRQNNGSAGCTEALLCEKIWEESENKPTSTRCCVLRCCVVLALFRIRFLQTLRRRSALGTIVVIPLCFVVAAFMVGTLFSTDVLIYSDPLRVDIDSVLAGTAASGQSGSEGVVSCANPWSIALMAPKNGTSAVPTPPNTYLDLQTLAKSGGGDCADPTVAKYTDAKAFLDSIAPTARSPDSSTSYANTPLSIGGFGYTNEGPLSPVSPSWNDDAGYKHQTVGLAFNSSVVHSIPLLINMYGRAMLRHTLGYTGSEDHAETPDIVVDIHPLPYARLNIVDAAQLMLPMFLGSAFSSVAYSAVPLVVQRQTKVSHAMKLAGLSSAEFWLTQFLYDVTFGGVMVIASVIFIFVTDATWFMGAERMGATVGVLVTSTLSIAIMGYVLAFFFKQAEAATRMLPLLIALTTIIPYTMVWVLQANDDANTREVGFTLAQVMNVIPTIALQNGIGGIMVYSKKYPQGGGGGILDPRHNIVQSIIVNMGIVAAAVFVLVFSMVFIFFRGKGSGTQDGKDDAKRTKQQQTVELAETLQPSTKIADEANHLRELIESPITKLNKIDGSSEHDVDDDLVKAENARAHALIHGPRTRINNENNDNTQSTLKTASGATNTAFDSGAGGGLVVANLAKRFPGVMRRRALSGVSLVVPPRELMVLLGPNGAGKSTLMNVLTGDIALKSGDGGRTQQHGKKEGAFTRGHVRVSGVNIAHGGTQTIFQNSLLGYCAQYDAVFEEITVAEHLHLYGKIRNAPSKEAADGMCKALGLHEYLHTAAGKLSGGNKRKLSLALGLLGNPGVVILDEPTTGVDAHAKRRVWKVLTQYHQQTGAAVLLSTHSMEEAQAVASRVAILTAGVLRCVGTTRQLHVRYGFGYELEVELGIESTEANDGSNGTRRRAMQDSKAAFSEFVMTTWPGTTKTMEFNLRLIFQIPRGKDNSESKNADGEPLRVSAIIGRIG